MVGDADDRAPDRRGRPGRAGPGRPDRRLRGGQPEPVDQLGLLVRAQEQVDGRVAAAQARAIGLAHRAAGQHDAHRRVGRLELGELALPADDLLLGALADGAGVDDDEVGVLEGRSPPRSRRAAGGRPSPRSRSGSSGSRASRGGTAAGSGRRAGTRPAARRPARAGSRGAVGEAPAVAPTAPRSRTSRTGSGAGRFGCRSRPGHGTPKLGPDPVSSNHGTADQPRDVDRPADAHGARDRPRHRQRHLHLDPRPAAAGRPARPRPGRSASASRWACASCSC